MNAATGQVLYDTKSPHPSKGTLNSLRFIDLHRPRDLAIRIVLDNLSAHKAEPVAKRFARPKRARGHSPSTSVRSSWRNLVAG